VRADLNPSVGGRNPAKACWGAPSKSPGAPGDGRAGAPRGRGNRPLWWKNWPQMSGGSGTRQGLGRKPPLPVPLAQGATAKGTRLPGLACFRGVL